MKALTKFTSFLLLSTLTFSSFAKADEIILPTITKPIVLQEGVQRTLTDAQIAEILPWAKNSAVFLQDLKENTQDLGSEDKIERLVEGIKQVVDESNSKTSELFMRYVLNRAIALNEILDKEMDSNVVGTNDAKIRMLNLSISLALKYFETEIKSFKTNKEKTTFANFGIEYYSFLLEANKSIFDASAAYQIQRTAFEWLQWDLYRDLNNAAYAVQIVKINNALKTFPSKKISDKDSLNYIKQMKKINNQLKISDLKKASSNELKNSTSQYPKEILINETVVFTYSNTLVSVLAVSPDGTYVVKDLQNSSLMSGYSRKYFAPQRGCNLNICFGDNVIDTNSNSKATVVGIAEGDNFILKTEDGQLSSSPRKYIALKSGCIENYCVGKKAINTYTNDYVKIIAIKTDGTFVLEYANGSVSSGWTSKYITLLN